MLEKRGRSWMSVVLVVVLVIISNGNNLVYGDGSDNNNNSELQEQLEVLSKQMKTLIERRKEDLQIIEENLKKKLLKSPEIGDVQLEVMSLRQEIEQLRNGNFQKIQQQPPPLHTTQDKNEHLTIKWLSNAVSELKLEISEIQRTLNSTVILQNHEQVYGELSLLKTDVSNLNKELEIARKRNIKYEAELLEVRVEVGSIKDHCKTTALTCGKLKNQLKATQLEWNYNWKRLNENKSSLEAEGEEKQAEHLTRHRRLLKKHLIDLEKNTKKLKNIDEGLSQRMLKIEEEMRILLRSNKEERIFGNEIDDYVKLGKVNELPEFSVHTFQNLTERLAKIETNQRINAHSIFNFTKQLTNFDKLHMSMLELLENVEGIENKVDKSLPEFRKEISKLEIQIGDTASEVALLREGQSNTRQSLKTIGVSVSNLKDKIDSHHDRFEELNGKVENLEKTSLVQTSKLHDHIFKTESATVDLNSTKSAIHLVQELKSFEKEYKSIVNKLPHDCSTVLGPNGIYLISPGDGEPIMANCQDGWTTIQKRYDGSINFNRNWNEYSNGFGSPTGEHWLGNRNIHYLTKDNCTKLQINMKDIYGKYWQATYDDFRVADYSFGFKLNVDRYSGNASDALDYQNRMEFSTVDNDRDISNTHCASNYEGGWWFSHCQHANLNGRYNLGLTWFDGTRNEWIAVATSEMHVKRREIC